MSDCRKCLSFDWCVENGVKKCPVSLVEFMQIHGWLDEDAVVRDVPFKKLEVDRA